MAIEYKKQIVFTKDSTIYGHQSLDEGGFPKDAGNGKLSQVLDMAENQTVDSLKSKISITIDLEDSRLYHFNIDGVSVATFEIPADRFLKAVSYDDVTKVLTFTFFTGTGEESVSVDLSSLVDTYTAGNGLQLSGGVFSIKVKNTETRLKADSTGLYIDLSDITAKITAEETARKNADTALSGRIDDLTETVEGIETRVDAKVAKAETAATNASNSATSAQASATTATEKATSATNSASRASTSEANAKASETNAKDSEDNAKASEDNASASEANAKLSETKAKASETNAKASETNAKASETSALASATKASSSETLARKWASNPVDAVVADSKYSAYHYSVKAGASATSASTSANTATTKASEASASASSASTSATNASSSASSASASATTASTKASEASNSANQAKGYRDEAKGYRDEINPSLLAPKVHTHTASDITNLLDTIYPVGSIYLTISTNPLNPSGSSPASWLGGQWELLPADKALWTASSGAGGTIDAGLPNIKGEIQHITCDSEGVSATGSLMLYNYQQGWRAQGTSNYVNSIWTLGFNAAFGEIHNGSYSNFIYGKKDTVQPPAYKVYAWRRKA